MFRQYFLGKTDTKSKTPTADRTDSIGSSKRFSQHTNISGLAGIRFHHFARKPTELRELLRSLNRGKYRGTDF